MKEKAAILGTPAALYSLGQIMTELDQNTGIKAQSGLMPAELISFPAMRLMLLPDNDAKLDIAVPPSSLTLSAGKNVFKVLGQSLMNSYAKDDKPGHHMIVGASKDNVVIDNPRRILQFKSVEPEMRVQISEDFAGNNSGRNFN